MSSRFSDVDQLCVNTIRTLSIDAVQNANSGHPGMPLGAAPMAYVLFTRHLRHAPGDPAWPDRDRFVLSGGHGSMLLYSLLHLCGYELSLDDIKDFRQWGSRTPGHPESFETAGVDATTGPLGQGSANAAGMAIAERHLAHRFNAPGREPVDHRSYALVTDGDLMEGLSAETASLAGHLGLGRLVYLYDANDVSLDGPNTLTFTEDVEARYASYGWQVLRVEDGDHDLAAIDDAITAARDELDRPSIVVVKTTIGFGSPNKGGTSSSHGAPLGEDEVRLVKQTLGFDPDQQFHVPAQARAHFKEQMKPGEDACRLWHADLREASKADPDFGRRWKEAWELSLPAGWDDGLPLYETGSKVATRSAGGEVVNALAAKVPWLLGGDADLGCSTKTTLTGESSFDASGAGRNIHYGVREHAMAAFANGMCYHGGVRPFVSTFFCFSDYMRPSIRLAALSRLAPIFVFTHDSIAVGEDGPTHQPVEHLMSLRTMPELVVIRPGDANETTEAWRWIVQQNERPVALVLSRQGLPVLDRAVMAPARGLERGGYVLLDPAEGDPEAILIGTGGELHLAVEAAEALAIEGRRIRVVSMPSWKIFAAQDRGYREGVLPPSVSARLSVEAGVTLGWERWLGDGGRALGIDRFGASAPGGELLERFGFTGPAVADAVRELLRD